MRYEIQRPDNIQITPEQQQKFWKFIRSSDLDFYEEYVIYLSDEE